MNTYQEQDLLKRNVELEKELAAKNHELEIEVSLERVRTTAMTMKEPADMLEVCKIISDQLEILEVKKIRNVQTAIFYEDKSSYMNYEYYAKHDKLLITDVDYNNHPVAEKFANQMLKGPNQVWTHGFKGEEVKDWLKYQRSTNVFIDDYLETADSLNYYWYSLGPVALGMSTYVLLNENEIDLFKRFRNVFELAYRRYLDIEKAQAQAREAQIEVSLERIRARTMGMHSSNELAEVAALLFEQVKHLGVETYTSGFNIWDREHKNLVSWMSNPVGVINPPFEMPIHRYDQHKRIYESWRNHESFMEDDLKGEALVKHYQFLRSFPLLDEAFTRSEVAGIKTPDRQVHNNAHFSNGYLLFITLQPCPQAHDIFKRFAKVFDQTYTRFLDLQKAEAQAREAKIEVALERARTQSMIMQHSKELDDTLRVFHEQILLLGINSAFSFLWLPDEGKNNHIFWAAWAENFAPNEADNNGSKVFKSKAINYPLDRNEPATALCLVDWKGKEPVVSYHVPPAGVESYFAAWQELISGVEQLKPEYFSNGLYYVEAFMKYGCFGVMIESELPEEEKKILGRFAIEFERTYTRFLDLQKAEAQAKESQIQLALERVRARTMAMQHSNELQETAILLFQQVKSLDILTGSCSFNIWDADEPVATVWSSSVEGNLQAPFKLSHTESPIYKDVYASMKRGDEILVKKVGGEELKKHFVYLTTVPVISDVINKLRKSGYLFPENIIYHIAFFKQGYLSFHVHELQPEAKEVFVRFAKVFEQTYTRFLDLQKAEAQAREAKIEAALEKVRSRSLAMHKSEELQEVVTVVFDRLKDLDIQMDAINLDIFKENIKDSYLWTSVPGQRYSKEFHIPFTDVAIFKDIYDGLIEGKELLSKVYSREEKNEFFKYVFTHSDFRNVPEDRKKLVLAADGCTFSVAYAKNAAIMAYRYYQTPFTDGENDILKRFAKVFEQCYTRFKDLQKAEVQARDAQIEVALERVRSKVMAMSSSKDLNETSLVFGEQLRKLGIDWQFSYFWLVDEAKNENVFWITWPDYKTSFTTYTLAEAKEYFNDCLVAWRGGVKVHDNYVPPSDVQPWLDTFQRIAVDAGGVAKEVMQFENFTNGVYYYDAMMRYGSFGVTYNHPSNDEEKNIQCRFAIEFERAYTRFLDLKQAEAQAREAQIELGLEKVRAKAMAMHKSDDLRLAVATVFEELDKLDLGLIRCGIAILDKEKPRGDIWITIKSEKDSTIEVSGDEPLDIHPLLKGAYDAWLKQQDFSYVLQNDELLNYYRAITKTNFQGPVSASFDTEKNDQQQHYFNAVFQDGSLFAFLHEAFTDEAKTVMKRFANVFNLTYKRFLDLQKAEAQAREARIETALEKVRASTMAMQRSEDLSQTAFVLFNQFKELGQAPERIFIATFDDHDNGVVDLWGTDQGGKQLNKLFKVPVNEPTMVSKIVAAWKEKKKSVVVDLKGEELKTYLGFLKQAGIPVTEGILDERRVQTAAYFSNGVIGVTTSEPQSAEAVQLQERFAGVFDLTYTRFLDLQKAEAQTREALIEGALERVRARALAMQQPEELKDVAQVLRNEMGALGVEELETCSIYIHGDSSENVECWYALQDPKLTKKKMVSDHFVLNLDDTWVGREMKKFYGSGEKQTSIVMQGMNRKEWINYCYEHSPVFSGFYGDTIPDRTYHLYKFSHGYIGAAAPGDISGESWKLLGRAASVFSLAYSRFKDLTQARNDLIKLKEEKKRAEDALTELQTTQKQLIQAEKMASLGELTAGIAHEIQNPLNFVNNFSDVSNELLEEMKTELEKGNAEGAKAIAIDVKENLEKILHHGKRADAIVKGMLQHSRSSSGQKELTDINVLAEEYLRLAYHGLRAKDKFFNAKFETDLDRSINKINIVPQEIGRVILNLINNSFYAVSEKKRNVSNGYEPSVTVSTKKINASPDDPLGRDKVEIRVMDNGNGIPKKVLDKIFQPFFTTKPTGEGTGLGLSLSYDIVTKGHDGEIKVETKEGEGSAFIISLPMK